MQNNFPLSPIYAIINEKLVRRSQAPGVSGEAGRRAESSTALGGASL